MSERELYQQKMKAQLDEWKAEAAKLRAKASGASADAQLGLSRQAKELEAKIESGKAKLAELAESSEEAWASVKEGVESAWESVKSAGKDAAAKLEK